MVWDRKDYLLEAERQLGDTSIYKDVSFNDKILSDLVDNSNKLFQCLKRKGLITDKELKYFLYNYKNSTNLGKLYLLPKIHKRLSNGSCFKKFTNEPFAAVFLDRLYLREAYQVLSHKHFRLHLNSDVKKHLFSLVALRIFFP